MDIQNAIQSCTCKSGVHKIIGIVLMLFLLSLTAWFGVGVWSKITTGVDQNPASITVSGDGEVYAKPDLGLVDFSVVTEKKTVAEAMTENTKKMNAVVAAVKAQGVDAKDMQTTNFSIYPKYEYQDRACTSISSYCPPGKQILVGYEITNQLQIKVRNLDKVGDIVQKATDAGANQVGNLTFTIDEEDALKAQARKEAIDKAKAKAKELASQLGVRLVKITSFSENGYTPYYSRDYMVSATKAVGMGGGAESVPAPQIETGQNKITSSVSITYEIK